MNKNQEPQPLTHELLQCSIRSSTGLHFREGSGLSLYKSVGHHQPFGAFIRQIKSVKNSRHVKYQSYRREENSESDKPQNPNWSRWMFRTGCCCPPPPATFWSPILNFMMAKDAVFVENFISAEWVESCLGWPLALVRLSITARCWGCTTWLQPLVERLGQLFAYTAADCLVGWPWAAAWYTRVQNRVRARCCGVHVWANPMPAAGALNFLQTIKTNAFFSGLTKMSTVLF